MVFEKATNNSNWMKIIKIKHNPMIKYGPRKASVCIFFFFYRFGNKSHLEFLQYKFLWLPNTCSLFLVLNIFHSLLWIFTTITISFSINDSKKSLKNEDFARKEHLAKRNNKLQIHIKIKGVWRQLIQESCNRIVLWYNIYAHIFLLLHLNNARNW